MLGNKYRDSHAEDPETQRKVNAMKNKKIFFLLWEKEYQSNGKNSQENAHGHEAW